MANKWSGFEREYRSLCDVLDVDELRGSQTYRVDHLSCSDTRRRLYFTAANEDGKQLVKAYCHNCSWGTVRSVGGLSIWEAVQRVAHEDRYERQTPFIPDDAVSICTTADPLVPEAAVAYFAQYGVNPRDLKAVYSANLGRIVIPIHDCDPHSETPDVGEYLGYIARAVPGTTGYGSRFITASGVKPFRTWYGPQWAAGPHSRLVFTEDTISASKVGMTPGFVGVPLFGLNVQPDSILRYCRQWPDHRPVVWLDNDLPSVEPRERIRAVLTAMGYKPLVIMTLSEPKKHPLEKIKDVLTKS